MRTLLAEIAIVTSFYVFAAALTKLQSEAGDLKTSSADMEDRIRLVNEMKMEESP